MIQLKKMILSGLSLLTALSFPLAGSWAKRSEPAKDKSDGTAAVTQIDNVEALSRWMTYYYLHPQPELFVPALIFADNQGLLKGDSAAPVQAFASRVMAQNPEKIKDWFSKLGSLSESGRTLLLTAIWWSDTKEGKEVLDGVAGQLPPKPKEELAKQIAKAPPVLEKMDIESPDVLDMLWACFSATGDEKYVKRLLSTLSWGKADSKDLPKMLIASAAKWSLRSNIQQHARVREICTSLEKEDSELKPYLLSVLEDANASAPSSALPNREKRKQDKAASSASEKNAGGEAGN